MTVFYVVLLIIILAVGLPTAYAALIGAPVLFAPKKAIKEALEAVDLRSGEMLYDLGCGTGRACLIGVRDFGAQAVGFELSPIFCAFARWTLAKQCAVGATVRMRNFYLQDLSGADVVYCFLTPPAMMKLRTKFDSELKVGTRVVSYSFEIPGWSAQKVITGYPGNIYCYIKE